MVSLARPILRFAGTAMLLAAGACVTTIESIDPAGMGLEGGNPIAEQGPVIIPISEEGGPAGGAPLDQYYRAVVGQMREAYLDGDRPALEALLQVHDRDSAPDWVRPKVERFRQLAVGLGFRQWLAETSEIVLLPPRPEDGALAGDGDRVPLGAPMRLRIHLGAAPIPEEFATLVLRGAGRDEATRFRAGFVIQDTFARGDRGRVERELMVVLPDDHALADGPAILPIELELPAGEAVIRDIDVQIEMLAGYVAGDEGARIPRHGSVLARDRFSLYPARVGQVEAAPLAVLQRALELQDARFHPHVLLAARFLTEAERPKAVAPLIEWVRLGAGREPEVAMAALTAITGEAHGRDREAWLRWFQASADLYR